MPYYHYSNSAAGILLRKWYDKNCANTYNATWYSKNSVAIHPLLPRVPMPSLG